MSTRFLSHAFSIAVAVAASSVASAQMQSMAVANANGLESGTSLIPGPIASASQAFSSDTGHGYASASAEEGRLHAYAEAFSKAPAANVPLNSMCVVAESSFLDRIHVGGLSGQTTTITLGLHLDGTLAGTGSSAYASFTAGDYGMAEIDLENSGSFDRLATLTFEAPENSDFYIAGLLGASATADATLQTGDVFCRSDFGNTAHFYLASSDPLAPVVGSTGFRYSQPVPEPASLCALGVGMVAVLRRRKR